MKKLFALLLALLMLCSVALAEDAAAAETGVSVAANEIVNHELIMDAIPEGYEFWQDTIDGAIIYAIQNPNDAEATVYMGSVSFSEEFDGYTLDIASLSEAELEQMKSFCGEDWNDPTFTFAKTSHGTDVIIVDENGVETDYADIFTIYQGYFITVSIFNPSGEVTQADLDLGLKALSDMWIVNK